MTGHVYLTEYSNFGDVAGETPVEPAYRVQKVSIGECSEQLHNDTRCVALFATFPCRVSFTADEHDEERAWPLAEGVEVIRMVRPNTKMDIHIFPEELS